MHRLCVFVNLFFHFSHLYFKEKSRKNSADSFFSCFFHFSIIFFTAYTSKPKSVYPHTSFSLTLFLPLHILQNQNPSIPIHSFLLHYFFRYIYFGTKVCLCTLLFIVSCSLKYGKQSDTAHKCGTGSF